jgi:dolichol-phosphate mannosyltransferase
MVALARQGILRFSVAPLRLAILVGGCTCLLSLAYLVYVILVRVFSGEWVPGWASVAGLLALLGGVQLLLIGILGEYVGLIFEIQLGKPTWVIAEEVGAPPGDEAT